jgi:glutathione synthase/RimK-type ligase-like ATP-grasp enzyme
VAVARGLDVEWLSNLERLFVAENKLVQQAAARELDIAVPLSAVTSTRERIPRELGESLIVKPLGPGQFVGDEGVAQVLYARELARDAPELDAIGGAPFLVQERLDAERHLRVVTVGARAWVSAFDAGALPVDWRRVDEAHDAFVPSDEHEDVAEQARRLAARLGVRYSSQDWLIVDGRPYFLDLNPGGQWLFLPEPVASAVTAEIAVWLAGDNAADASGTG